MKSILTALKADHKAAKSLLEEILAATSPRKRATLFETFKSEITAHSRAEEKNFYEPLAQTGKGKDEALEGTVEHQIVDRLLADLASAPDNQADEWTARCRVLQELLEHHIEEEEGDFFKTARKQFDEKTLGAMGEAFLAEKRRLADPAAATKAA